MKNKLNRVAVSDEIVEYLINVILSAGIWNHSEYEKGLLKNKESWIKMWGEDWLRNDLADSKQRDGKIYRTKQQVKNIPKYLAGLKIELRFREKNHKIPHFHVYNKQGSVSASFCMSKCNMICGKCSKSLCKKIKEWFFRYKGKQKLEKIMAKANELEA